MRAQTEGDAFVAKEGFEVAPHVFVFAMRQRVIAIDNRDAAAEAAKGLCEFESNISAAKDQQVFRDAVEFEGLDVREGSGLRETGYPRKGRTRSGADDNFVAANDANVALWCSDLKSLRLDEARRANEQLSAAPGELFEVHSDEAGDHEALALADGSHVDEDVVLANAELFAAEEVGGDLGAVNDVLAGQTSDVGARATNIFALHKDYASSHLGHCPGEELAPFAASENDKIVAFLAHSSVPCLHCVQRG